MKLEDGTPLLYNRGFLFSDQVVESFVVNEGEILFWEAHYFRLMASMRILRMKIPMEFTPEYLEGAILDTLNGGNTSGTAQGQIAIWRSGAPGSAEEKVTYTIMTKAWDGWIDGDGEKLGLTLFKDHKLCPGLLSSVHGQGEMVYVLGRIFARGNGFDAALVMNADNSVVGSTRGAIFIVQDRTVVTPPIQDGVYNDVYRNTAIKLLKNIPGMLLVEKSVTAFDISKADEVFAVACELGVSAFATFRKSVYTKEVSVKVRDSLAREMKLVNSG